jgi:hypothetical protein
VAIAYKIGSPGQPADRPVQEIPMTDLRGWTPVSLADDDDEEEGDEEEDEDE